MGTVHARGRGTAGGPSTRGAQGRVGHLLSLFATQPRALTPRVRRPKIGIRRQCLSHSASSGFMRLRPAIAALLIDSLLAAAALEGVAPAPHGLREVRECLEAALGGVPRAGPQPEPAGDVATDYSATARAVAVLEEASRAEEGRNWRRAADLYQRLLDEAPDALCRPSPRLYVPIREHVEERLASFPPEGLAAYREQVDRVAEGHYAAAAARGDLAGLGAVASRFLLSSSGDNALDRLATAWLARGEPGRALRAWRRLLALCPDSDVAPAPLAAKLAVCLAQLQACGAAESLLRAAAERLGPNAKAAVAGEATDLASLARALAALPQRAADDAEWPVTGGDASQSRVPRAAVRPGTLLWADVVQPREASRAAADPRVRLFVDGEGMVPEPSVRVLPIVSNGVAVYPTRSGVVAREASTGKLRWEWPWQGEARDWRGGGPFTMPGSYSGSWCCSAAGLRVFCSIPMQVVAARGEGGIGGELVALDARTGALLWRCSALSLLPADRAAGGWFVSAPLPVEGRLVVGLRGGAGGDDFYLCGLSTSDGGLLWRTFIAARPSDPLYRFGRYEPWFEGMAAESRGLAIACAGGGIVAGVEVASGAIRWLSRYDQVASRRAGWRWYRHDGWRSWTPLVADGIAYATPPDSDYLYAMDADTGRLLWRSERGDHRYVAGARGRRVCLVGSDAACLGPRGEVEWQAPLPTSAAGRPVVAGRVLHVPVAGGIVLLDCATGGELAQITRGDLAASAGQGADPLSRDLLIAAGKLFVATPYSLSVFAPLERLAAIQRQLAGDPDDPMARYALGQEQQWMGDAPAAIQALTRVVEAATRQPGSVDAAVLSDAKRRLAACHGEMATGHEAAGRLDLALGSSETALAHLPPGSERTALLLRVAALAHRLRRWDRAATACQEVLGACEPDEAPWQTARAALDALLRAAGRQPYEAFEGQAAAALERGGEADLEAIVKRYPNSHSAPAALLSLAERADAAGNRAAARLWLHQLVNEYPEAEASPAALRRLAVAYARDGSSLMARGAAERLRRLYPGHPEARDAEGLLKPASLGERAPAEALKPPFQEVWTVRPTYGAPSLQVVAGDGRAFFVLAGRALECRELADGSSRWADRPGWIGIRIVDADRPGGGVRIVSTVSEAEDAPAERAGLRSGDVLVAFEGKRLRDAQELIALCTERRAGSTVRLEIARGDAVIPVPLTLGARPSLGDDARLPPAALAGVVGGRAIVRKATRVDAIALDRGDVAWSFAAEGPSEPSEDGAPRTTAAAPGIVALADTRGRLTALDSATGKRLWASRIEEPVVHDVELGELGLVLATSRPPTVRVLNPVDGHPLFEATEPRTAGPPVVALDRRGRLCYAMGSQVGCYDGPGRGATWAVRVANFAARQVWAAADCLVALGVDDQGVEAIECRRLVSGEPAWSLAMARGERVLFLDVGADALFVASRQAARVTVRRLEASTGQVAWSHVLTRQQELAAWEASGATIALGLTVADANGTRLAQVLALDKVNGSPQQSVMLGAGGFAGLARLDESLCAVVEDEPRFVRPAPWLADDVPSHPARFRLVRLAPAR